METPYRSAAEVTAALASADVGTHLSAVLDRYESGQVAVTPRGALGLGPDGAVTHVMTARDLAEKLVLTKVIDYDPARPRRDGRASSAGVLTLLLDGVPVLVAPADLFTGIRTGLVAAFAIDGLAPSGDLEVALLGPGLVGQQTLHSLAARRGLTGVRVCGRDPDRTSAAATALEADLGLRVRVVATVGEACTGAQVLVTATSAVEPVVDVGDLGSEVSVVAALGAGIAERRELTAATVAAFDAITVDSVDGAREEAGDLVQAASEGVAFDPMPLGEAVRRGPINGRQLYKSVGSPWQDLACALAAMERLEPGWRGPGAAVPVTDPR